MRHTRRGTQHTSAYVSIRQHTSAYVSIRQHTAEYGSIRYACVIPVAELRLVACPAVEQYRKCALHHVAHSHYIIYTYIFTYIYIYIQLLSCITSALCRASHRINIYVYAYMHTYIYASNMSEYSIFLLNIFFQEKKTCGGSPRVFCRRKASVESQSSTKSRAKRLMTA
jgi:hypothetical protein